MMKPIMTRTKKKKDTSVTKNNNNINNILEDFDLQETYNKLCDGNKDIVDSILLMRKSILFLLKLEIEKNKAIAHLMDERNLWKKSKGVKIVD